MGVSRYVCVADFGGRQITQHAISWVTIKYPLCFQTPKNYSAITNSCQVPTGYQQLLSTRSTPLTAPFPSRLVRTSSTLLWNLMFYTIPYAPWHFGNTAHYWWPVDRVLVHLWFLCRCSSKFSFFWLPGLFVIFIMTLWTTVSSFSVLSLLQAFQLLSWSHLSLSHWSYFLFFPFQL